MQMLIWEVAVEIALSKQQQQESGRKLLTYLMNTMQTSMQKVGNGKAP